MCVCVCLFLLRVYFQNVSRVAHVNDCVEDRSERRLTSTVAALFFFCREVLLSSRIVEQGHSRTAHSLQILL